MLFSPSCREFNSLQKKDIQPFYIGPILFSENKIIRSVLGGNVDGQILFSARSEKLKIVFGVGGEKPKILFDSQRVNIRDSVTDMVKKSISALLFTLFTLVFL